LIYLDTHVVVWLYAGLRDQISALAEELINANEIRVSPIVRLELQYLFEIERIAANSDAIVEDLSNRIGLEICDRAFDSVVKRALTHTWTRDPFDRLIVAHADLRGDILITKDENIWKHYSQARWG
jgi:PIN domain nuclease of toxin-antitoxin system